MQETAYRNRFNAPSALEGGNIGNGISGAGANVRARPNALAGYGSVSVGAIAESHAVVTLSIEDSLSWLPAPNVVKGQKFCVRGSCDGS